MSEQRYLIVIEGDRGTSYSASSPDVPDAWPPGPHAKSASGRCARQSPFTSRASSTMRPVPEPHSTAAYAVVDVAPAA